MRGHFQQSAAKEKKIAVCYQVLGQGYSCQSYVGVSFPGKTFLFDRQDENICSLLSVYSDLDEQGRKIEVVSHRVYVGRFLDRLYPAEKNFEIFCLYLDACDSHHRDPVPGEAVASWEQQADSVQGRLYCRAGWESLCGNPLTRIDGIVNLFRVGRLYEAIYRTPVMLAEPSPYLVRPAEETPEPVAGNSEDRFILRVEREMRQKQLQSRVDWIQ